ncbi:MAG TPA: DUF2188 domain-containing protein [Naasia sp.]|jgi:hypothetical protein
MADGDVTTRNNRGQWENSVEGDPAASASFSSRDEAVEQGRATAERSGGRHIVQDEDPTGAITDPGGDQPSAPPGPVSNVS